MLAAAAAATIMAAPEQVHLAFKTPTSMWISWADKTGVTGALGSVVVTQGSDNTKYSTSGNTYQYQSESIW